MTQPPKNLGRPCQRSAAPELFFFPAFSPRPAGSITPKTHRCLQIITTRLRPDAVRSGFEICRIYSLNFHPPAILLRHLSPFSLNPEIAWVKKKRSDIFPRPQSGAQLSFFPFFFFFFPPLSSENGRGFMSNAAKASLSISNNAVRKLLWWW